jgi:restriction system protein
LATPLEFENLVAAYFIGQGYQVEKTSLNYDYGVDLIASKGGQKVAIQVKMYDLRKVNHEAIMLLSAGQNYYGCQSSIIVTSGILTKQAQDVAKKLGVEIINNWCPDEAISSKIKMAKGDIFFEYLWKNHVMVLLHKELKRNERVNKIVDVNWDFLKRLISNNKVQKIPIEIFRQVVNLLVVHGEVEREKINELYVKRASSGICLILTQNPYIEIVEKPKMKLVLNKIMYNNLMKGSDL